MECSSGTKESLSTLLEDEDFLLKIFEHLTEYGLHEVRRVCRKWYQVSRKLPICTENVPLEHLADVAEHFPNATQLDIDEILHDLPNRDWFVADQLSHLASFQDLKALSLDECLNPELAEVVALSIRSFSGLQSLKLILTSWDDNTELCAQIRQLTKLTSLEIGINSEELPRLAPFTELQNIQSLAFYPCVNEDGDFMFPALTNLVHLNLVGLFNGNAVPPTNRFYEAILAHRSSLRTLEVGQFEVGSRLPHRFMTCLMEFTQLKWLNLQEPPSILGSPSIFNNSDLRDLLAALRGLTFLGGVRLNEHSAGVVESLCSLTELESLTLDLELDADKYLTSFSSLSQLTHLHLCLYRPIGQQPGEESIALACQTWSYMITMLNSLKHLETFLVKDSRHLTGPFPFPSHCLAAMENLKCLDLSYIHLDDMFSSTLASLQQLTELDLLWCKGFDRVSFADIRFLTNLERLGLSNDQSQDLSDCLIEARLPKLKYLSLFGPKPSEEKKTQLYQSLPCLRRID